MAEGTYDEGQATTKDWIRGLIGDTGPTFTLADVTLLTMVGKYTDPRLAAAEAADNLASLYLKRAQSFARGSQLNVSYTDRSTNLRKKAADLRGEVRREEEQAAAPTGFQTVQMTRGDDDAIGEYRRLRRELYGI